MANMKRLAFVLALTAVLAYPQTVSPPIRELGVLVMADEEFQADPEWFLGVSGMISAASDEFSRLFGIRLVVRAVEPWISDNGLTRLDAMAEWIAANVVRRGNDIIIARTAQTNLSSEYSCVSLFKEGVILLSDAVPVRRMTATLEHELGHLFGAVHIPDISSVMSPVGTWEGFDNINREIVLLNKERSFNLPDSPVLPCAEPEALDLYKKACKLVEAYQAGDNPLFLAVPGFAEVTDRGEPRVIGFEDVFILLSHIYLKGGQYAEALSACQEAVRLNPDNIEALNNLGIIYRRMGNVEAAIQMYREVFKKDPKSPKVLFNLGIALSKKGDIEAAHNAYAAAIAMSPRYAEAHNNIGEIYLHQGRLALAQAEFRASIEYSPTLALAHSNLAEAYFRNNRLELARAEAETAVRLKPQLVEAVLVLGNVARGQGRTEEAVGHYLKARSLDPDNERAAINLGICAFGRGAFAEAERYFEEALKLNASSPEAHLGLGTCLLKKHDLDGSKRELRTALNLGLNSAEVHLNLSTIALEKKNADEAIAEAKLTLDLSPGIAAAYENLGYAYTIKGMNREAQEAFRKARLNKKEPDLNPLHIHDRPAT